MGETENEIKELQGVCKIVGCKITWSICMAIFRMEYLVTVMSRVRAQGMVRMVNHRDTFCKSSECIKVVDGNANTREER